MTIRKVFSNHGGSLLVSIPKDYAAQRGITKDSYVNTALVGNTLHLTVVKLE